MAPVAPPASVPNMDQMNENALAAARFLKTLGHEGRLMILCHLVPGERSVTDLEALTDLRQPAVSQHLSRLRDDGLVAFRRDGKTIYYHLADPRARQMLELLYGMFCDNG